jgi:hypothetical protein
MQTETELENNSMEHGSTEKEGFAREKFAPENSVGTGLEAVSGPEGVLGQEAASGHKAVFAQEAASVQKPEISDLNKSLVESIAKVRGEAFTALPLDLYIPPDAMEVILEIFEGPLDLLLYLIRKHNLNILDIPVA